ncbi:MAG: protein-(glutamine-N5) methyltransferase, release factor-specific [Caulobacterales bacterium 32-67-6]|nr:MAG: protein-(glutamine-N5) methyltransferase, release factor-specific [Caulobacterales bacterium 32-67-6]
MSLTLLKAWGMAKARLEAVGLSGPVIDARLLVEAAADATRLDIVTDPHRLLSAEQEARLEDYLERRSRREPVSHILGRKGFWKIMLQVTPDVLTPRPDTECVVDAVLKATGEHERLSILDLGVGSGAILLAILAERPNARGLGVDVSEDALAVARDNAAHLGLAGRCALLRGDWADGLSDVSFECRQGGADGLDAYRRLAPEILRVLKPGGRFAVEIGYDQKAAVEALFQEAGAEEVSTQQDLAGLDRVVLGKKRALETPA